MSGVLNFQKFAVPATWGAIAVQIHTFSQIIRAGSGVADAETGGVFDDQPGIEQTPKLQYPNDGQHQNWQDQRKLHHALRLFRPALLIVLKRKNIHKISFDAWLL